MKAAAAKVEAGIGALDHADIGLRRKFDRAFCLAVNCPFNLHEITFL